MGKIHRYPYWVQELFIVMHLRKKSGGFFLDCQAYGTSGRDIFRFAACISTCGRNLKLSPAA